jgi:hypothetical protein
MDRRRVDLQTAAELLGISSAAVRKRAKRGSIPYETGADGKLYVWVDEAKPGETDDYPPEDDRREDDRRRGGRDELVEELRDRVGALEAANRENRRIIAALTSRIPELEAPRDSAPAQPMDEREETETAAADPPVPGAPPTDTAQPMEEPRAHEERREAREEAERLRAEVEAERLRAQVEAERLREALEAERSKGFWRRLFGG